VSPAGPGPATDAPYGALAAVYDRWTADNDFDHWAADLDRRLRAAGLREGAAVVELCCGTGLVAERLAARGWRMTGVDRSAPMLDVARRRLGDRVDLVHADLAAPGAAAALGSGAFDAAICTFDSVNYFDDGGVAALLAVVGEALRPGAPFVFDVNSAAKLGGVFADSHYGDDLGEFAYVWRNRTSEADRRTEFLITLFLRRPDGAYDRRTERHVQRWFSHGEVRAFARAHGFDVTSVTDDYSERPVHQGSLREVWSLRKALPKGPRRGTSAEDTTGYRGDPG
jgi:SAM-dependent methyltransferase